ncbi:hypothetical protein NERG_00496 [Nematocida ausubeli]|uniref:Uncharacterized protein n=1 Tax=Nematocida ausubeli (strain ATCC PRA-371 / ERTm2) TaxID=1913371 RepID=H8ZA75_NEMA1|nr:hypothetical protein NERG_00496 [Nematocida ausubeli]
MVEIIQPHHKILKSQTKSQYELNRIFLKEHLNILFLPAIYLVGKQILVWKMTQS